jgi:hypothetical protein
VAVATKQTAYENAWERSPSLLKCLCSSTNIVLSCGSADTTMRLPTHDSIESKDLFDEDLIRNSVFRKVNYLHLMVLGLLLYYPIG